MRAWTICSAVVFSSVLVCIPLSQLQTFNTIDRAIIIHLPIILYRYCLLVDTTYARSSYTFDAVQRSIFRALQAAFIIQIFGLVLGISGLVMFMVMGNSTDLVLVSVLWLNNYGRTLIESGIWLYLYFIRGCLLRSTINLVLSTK